MIVIVAIAIAVQNVDTGLGKITVAATATVAVNAIVAVNAVVAIVGAAIVAKYTDIEEVDVVAAVADDAFGFIAHRNPIVCSSVTKCTLSL